IDGTANPFIVFREIAEQVRAALGRTGDDRGRANAPPVDGLRLARLLDLKTHAARDALKHRIEKRHPQSLVLARTSDLRSRYDRVEPHLEAAIEQAQNELAARDLRIGR